MMRHGLRAPALAKQVVATLVLAAVVATSAVPLGAANEPASANAALFETNHLAKVAKGEELVYRFQRTVSEAKLLGAPFSDDIKVKVLEDKDGMKEVKIDIFTGERAREPQVEPNRTGNPVIVVFLERAINNFGILSGANKNYAKQQFIAALRQRGKLEPVKIEFAGKTVDGHRIAFEPYRGDKSADRMAGYDISRFSFVLSDNVPGYIAELTTVYESTKEHSPKLDERLTLTGVGAIK